MCFTHRGDQNACLLRRELGQRLRTCIHMDTRGYTRVNMYKHTGIVGSARGTVGCVGIATMQEGVLGRRGGEGNIAVSWMA